jgi:hypothetical protein
VPVILRFNGIDFFFYSNEHRPIHVHVRKAGAIAKVQIEGGIKVTFAEGFSPKSLKLIKKFCEEHADLIIDQWEGYFDV